VFKGEEEGRFVVEMNGQDAKKFIIFYEYRSIQNF